MSPEEQKEFHAHEQGIVFGQLGSFGNENFFKKNFTELNIKFITVSYAYANNERSR